MPRNLTDLMEAAVSTAPPEPHQAADITRLAERRQRRRTTFVAGAAALAVVAVAGGAFGLTRGQGTTPEPAAPFKYGDLRPDPREPCHVLLVRDPGERHHASCSRAVSSARSASVGA